MRRSAFSALLALITGITLAFLAIPIVALFTEVPLRDVPSLLGKPAVQDALKVTIRTNLIANALILGFGTPTAWLIARRRFPGRSLVVTLVELPLVLPPAVAGIALLAALGPDGLLGGALGDAGIQLVLQTTGVVVALIFVAAPFHLRAAQAAFAAVDPRWSEASRTLGAGEARTFARVTVPAALPGLAAGLALAWGRALGEFGATLMFAGSFRGITQTAPLAIYAEFASDFDGALALSAVLVAVSAALLLSTKLLARDALARA